MQRISCRQIHVLSGNHTGFLGGDTEQDAGQDLASKAKDRNTLVIITRQAIAFPLDYAGIF